MSDPALFEDFFDYEFPMPQYLGAKYRHLAWIGKFIPKNVYCVCDAFSGSQSVAFYFKQLGYRVLTNDFLSFCNQIGKALVENKSTKLLKCDIDTLFGENSNAEYYNLMETLYANLFFKKEECQFLDAFRSNVSKLSPLKQSLALSVMNRAMTRKVTMGHFAHTMALKYADNPDRVKRNKSLVRPLKNIFLELLPTYNAAVFDNFKNNKSYNEDAIALIKSKKEEIDLLYLDPPYCGSHADYQGFYHVLETYTEYWKDKTFINSVKCYSPKRISGFDKKESIIASFDSLFKAGKDIPYWIISYNDRSYPTEDVMLSLIKKYKNVEVVQKQYENSVGGKGSVVGSKELLFICGG